MKKHLLGVALITGLAASASATNPGEVVINEAMIPGVGTDNQEFIELKGPPGHDLSDCQLVFFNGGTAGAPSYDTISLAGQTIPLDGYFVVAGASTNVPTADLVDGPATNWLQNGDPDSIVLRRTGDLVVIDALGYFNQYNLGAVVPGTGPLVAGTHYEGTPLGSGGDDAWPTQTGTGVRVAPPAALGPNTNASVGRYPDGTDTGDNYSDFYVLATQTPGASNAGTATLSLPVTEDFSQATGLNQTWAPSFTSMLRDTSATSVPLGIPNSPDSVTPAEWVSVKDPTGGGEGTGIFAIGSNYQVSSYVFCPTAASTTEFAGVLARLNNLQTNIGFNFDQDFDADTDFGSAYGDWYYAISLNMATGSAQAQKVAKGVRTAVGSPVAITPNTWTKFDVICDGSTITYEIDDVQVGQLTGEPVRYGYVALGYYENDAATGTVRANFDGFSVTTPPVASVSDWTMISD